jgi:hypothetical protein
MIKFIIEGVRWFDKINGNTYHTIYIIDARNNKQIYQSDSMIYGYEDAYKQTAIDALIKMKKFKEINRFNHDLIRKILYFNVSDVERKKDL